MHNADYIKIAKFILDNFGHLNEIERKIVLYTLRASLINLSERIEVIAWIVTLFSYKPHIRWNKDLYKAFGAMHLRYSKKFRTVRLRLTTPAIDQIYS